MATTNESLLQIIIDEELLNKAEKLFKELGLTMNSAITIFLQETVARQALPFQLDQEDMDTLKALKDAETGNLHGGFDSIDSLIEDLDS